MPICGIYGCSNRPSVQTDVSYFKTPKILFDQGTETQKLSEERRRLWKAAVNRADITTEEKWERTIVCSKHFVHGKKSYLHDRKNPSWLPSLHLGHSTRSPTKASDRYARASGRKQKRETHDAAASLLKLKQRRIDFDDTQECTPDVANYDCSETCEPETDIQVQAKEVQNQEVQTENVAPSRNLYKFCSYENNDEKVAFYTGLPNEGLLKLVYQFIQDSMLNGNKCLSKENEYLLCLLKLRMNYLFKDMAYNLNVSLATVQRSFHSTLDVLHARLNFLIKWPTRENLRTSMPSCFRNAFGNKVVVILDCFELFTERPSGAVNKVYTYSNYKHHQTVKYLIGVAPQGVVSFISQGWGGRTPDKYITEKCGILKNLLPGDIVMVDRGFNIEDSVNFFQAEVAIPDFTCGKAQLHPLQVERTRKIASVRIHVERVIRLVVRKFRIFEGNVPLEFLKIKSGDSVPTIDKIVKVCCCLTNLCSSVVPLD